MAAFAAEYLHQNNSSGNDYKAMRMVKVIFKEGLASSKNCGST